MSELSTKRLDELISVHAKLLRIPSVSPILRSACADTVLALDELITLREFGQCIDAVVAKTIEA